MDGRSAGEAASTVTPPSPAGTPSEATGDEQAGTSAFGDLEERPVAEHVAVFEAEHARLQRELGTIDQL